jgi:hypothetical protein
LVAYLRVIFGSRDTFPRWKDIYFFVVCEVVGLGVVALVIYRYTLLRPLIQHLTLYEKYSILEKKQRQYQLQQQLQQQPSYLQSPAPAPPAPLIPQQRLPVPISSDGVVTGREDRPESPTTQHNTNNNNNNPTTFHVQSLATLTPAQHEQYQSALEFNRLVHLCMMIFIGMIIAAAILLTTVQNRTSDTLFQRTVWSFPVYLVQFFGVFALGRTSRRYPMDPNTQNQMNNGGDMNNNRVYPLPFSLDPNATGDGMHRILIQPYQLLQLHQQPQPTVGAGERGNMPPVALAPRVPALTGSHHPSGETPPVYGHLHHGALPGVVDDQSLLVLTENSQNIDADNKAVHRHRYGHDNNNNTNNDYIVDPPPPVDNKATSAATAMPNSSVISLKDTYNTNRGVSMGPQSGASGQAGGSPQPITSSMLLISRVSPGVHAPFVDAVPLLFTAHSPEAIAALMNRAGLTLFPPPNTINGNASDSMQGDEQSNVSGSGQ